jgi:hypothetical protein
MPDSEQMVSLARPCSIPKASVDSRNGGPSTCQTLVFAGRGLIGEMSSVERV